MVRITRSWTDGDTVTVRMPLAVRRTVSHPSVAEDRGRVALERGPLVYCLEDADNDQVLASLHLASGEPLMASFNPDLLGGIVTIDGQARIDNLAAWQGSLYAEAGSMPRKDVAFRAIPYYAWGNRIVGDMLVWLRSDPC